MENKKVTQKEKLPMTIGNWYLTFMCMSIPIFGWIYLMILAFSRKQPLKREFAIAYILYRLTIFSVCVILLMLMINTMIPYLNSLLDYMEML